MKENEKMIEVAKELLGEKKFNVIIKDIIRHELQEYFESDLMDDIFNDEKFRKQLISIGREEALNVIRSYTKSKDFLSDIIDKIFEC